MRVELAEGSELIGWKREGRFWRAGRIHRVSVIHLERLGGTADVVVKAETDCCGIELDFPLLSRVEPLGGKWCARAKR